MEGEARLWKAKDYSLLREFKLETGGFGVFCDFSKDGSKILLASGGEIKIMNISHDFQMKMGEKVSKELESAIHELYITHDEKHILVADFTSLHIMSLDDYKIMEKITIGEFDPGNISLFEDKNDHNKCFLLVLMPSRRIRVYDLNFLELAGISEKFVEYDLNPIKPVEFKNDLDFEYYEFKNKFLDETTIMFFGPIIWIVDISRKNPKSVKIIKFPVKWIGNNDVFFSKANSRIAFNYRDKIHCYYLNWNDERAAIKEVFRPVRLIKLNNLDLNIDIKCETMKFSPDGSKIYLLATDDVEDNEIYHVFVLDSWSGYTIKSHVIGKINPPCGRFSPDLKTLAFCDGGNLKILNTENLIESVCSNEILANIRIINFTKDSQKIITVSDETCISFFQLENRSLMYDSFKLYENLEEAESKGNEQIEFDISKILNRKLNVFSLLGSEHPFSIFHLICLFNYEKVLNLFLDNITEENSDLIYSLLYHRDFLNQTPYQMAIISSNIKILDTMVQMHLKLSKQSRYHSGVQFESDTLETILYYHPDYLPQILDSQLCAWNERKFLNLSLEFEKETFLEKFQSKYVHLDTISDSVIGKINPKLTKKMAFSIQVVMIDDILLPKNQFLNNLPKILDENHNIFDSKALSSLLEYKWVSFGRKKFLQTFARYGLYFSLVIISSLVFFPMRKFNYLPSDQKTQASNSPTTPTSTPNPPEMNYDQDTVYLASLISDIVTLSYFYLFIVSYEVKKVLVRKSNYLSRNMWNFLIILVGTFTMIFDIIVLSQSRCEDPSLNTVYTLKFFFFFNLILVWIRMTNFWRGFRITAALVRLLIRVFADMKAFFLVVFYLLIGFAMSSYLLQNNYEEYGKRELIKIYYNLILANMDDFDTMTKATSVFDYLFFIIYFLMTTFFIIIMMNLLIAIIYDTSAKVTLVEAKAFQFERLNLINEFEEYVSKSEEEHWKSKLKGTYLYVITSAKEISEKKEEEDNKLVFEKNKYKAQNSDIMIEEKFRDLSLILEQIISNQEILKSNHETLSSNQEIFKSNQESFYTQLESLRKPK